MGFVLLPQIGPASGTGRQNGQGDGFWLRGLWQLKLEQVALGGVSACH